MQKTYLLTSAELKRYEATDDWSDKLTALRRQQEETWDLLQQGYDGLDSVQTKTYSIDGFEYRIQFNPGRLTSSSAKVDELSIKERPCFLCTDNLPDKQRGMLYGDNYLMLCNPFPIFPEHFTIPAVRHVPQEILSSVPDLLALSKDLEKDFTVFYNGPHSGASAPDHLHFQAGSKGYMPIESEFERTITARGEKIGDFDGLLVFAISDILRRFIAFESDDAFLITKAFGQFYAVAQRTMGVSDEPMMNIISSYQEGEWRVIVFPRARHRPSFFFEEGEAKMVISPAAVDLGGIVITPIEKDFQRITKENIIQLFDEVCLSESSFFDLVDHLRKPLSELDSHA